MTRGKYELREFVVGSDHSRGRAALRRPVLQLRLASTSFKLERHKRGATSSVRLASGDVHYLIAHCVAPLVFGFSQAVTCVRSVFPLLRALHAE